MKTKDAKQLIDQAYQDGYVVAMLTARFHELHRRPDDDNFHYAPAPIDPPDVVEAILEHICTGCLYDGLFEGQWNYFDELLRCKLAEELEATFLFESTHRVH